MAIYKKLLEFQKQNLKVVKDGKNPHFKSTYPTLNSVLDKVTKPLNDMGIVIIQKPGTALSFINAVGTPVVMKEVDGLLTGLITKLVDTEDDSFVDCFMPYVGATDAQKLGSANTYNRRYSLVTLLGLEDEDDDGNTASAPKPAPRAAQKATEPSGEPFTGNPFKKKSTEEALATIEWDEGNGPGKGEGGDWNGQD